MEELAGKWPRAFDKYTNAELKNMIVIERNRYALQKNTISTFTVTDIETFNAALILTGYHSLPQTKIFCEKKKEIGLSIAYESISRKEFEDIKRYINSADNSQLDIKDKFSKVRKLCDIMNISLQQLNFFHSYYSEDEQMGSNKPFKQNRSALNTKILSCYQMMVIYTLLTRTVVPNTLDNVYIVYTMDDWSD